MALDLKGIVKNAVGTIYNLFGQISDAGQYHRVGAGSYNASTGSTGATDTAGPATALFCLFTEEEMQGRGDLVKSGDKKIILRTTDVPTRPGRDDYYTDAAGVRWDLELIQQEPTDNVWILRGRART